MDISLLIKTLKTAAHTLEAYQVTAFECFRDLPGGGVQEVVVEILDAGINSRPGGRYTCRARTKDGKAQAFGNAADSIETAITIVHWFDLERRVFLALR